MSDRTYLNRLSISVRDFELALEYAKEALRCDFSDRAIEALTFAALVCYYRPFTRNERQTKSSASPSISISDFPQLTETDLELHEKCKELRNKALAHSEFKMYPTRMSMRGDRAVIVSRPFALLERAPDLRELIALTEKLLDACHHRRANYLSATTSLSRP
jgi:hypothetical protein